MISGENGKKNIFDDYNKGQNGSRKSKLEIGQIVLIKTDGLPPGKWHLGRVIDKHPGLDGIREFTVLKVENKSLKDQLQNYVVCPLICRNTVIIS